MTKRTLAEQIADTKRKLDEAESSSSAFEVFYDGPQEGQAPEHVKAVKDAIQKYSQLTVSSIETGRSYEYPSKQGSPEENNVKYKTYVIFDDRRTILIITYYALTPDHVLTMGPFVTTS